MGRRFDDIKVGDQLVARRRAEPARGLPCLHYLVTDLWYDPVRGQQRRSSGEMVAIQTIWWDGTLRGSKYAHTIRGLAQAGLQFADTDFQGNAQALTEALHDGSVISLGAARRRKHPAPWTKSL